MALTEAFYNDIIKQKAREDKQSVKLSFSLGFMKGANNLGMNIDRKSKKPIYQQIYDNITDEIIHGYLIPEERLKSRRALSCELGVSPQTVESAYQKLAADGFVISRLGSGYYVSSDRVWNEEERVMKSRLYNFSTNGVETSKLPFAEWSKLMRITLKENTALFQHGEKAGEWCLRKSIRRYLFRTQNIKCRTEQIIIGPGAEDLLRDIFELLAPDSKILMNNYYNYRVNAVAKNTRNTIEYITSGENGIDIDELMEHRNGVLYQKPTHDLPTGITLTREKREELLKWIGNGRYIIEDSSDNDYQYGSREKTLWELNDGKNIIYLGSFSGTIAPSMKIGYIIAPEEIVKLWFEKKEYYTNRVSRIEQVTLSRFIDLGYYEKHVNYMRRVYMEKTLTLKTALENSPIRKNVTVKGDSAGMFCYMHLNINISEKRANQILTENRINISPLSGSVFDKSRAVFPECSYTIGYGELTNSQIREGIALVSDLLKDYAV